MSRLLITQYQTEVQKIIQFGGSRKETSIRVAFQNLLNPTFRTLNCHTTKNGRLEICDWRTACSSASLSLSEISRFLYKMLLTKPRRNHFSCKLMPRSIPMPYTAKIIVKPV
jgi:hypothetical protein